jgi:hypothetical protein
MRSRDIYAELNERNELRKVTRYPLAVHRDCAMCVITFKDLSWKDQFAYLKDISTSGVGVESEKRMDPGFVWFRDRVGGHLGGVLMWGKQVGYNYRAGIEFVPLSREAEQFVHGQVGLLRARQPLPNPEAVMTTIIESLSRTRKH